MQVRTSDIVGTKKCDDMFSVARRGRCCIGAGRMAVGSSPRYELLFPLGFARGRIVAQEADASLFEPVARGRDDLVSDHDRPANTASRNRDFPSDIGPFLAVKGIGKLGLVGDPSDVGPAELKPVLSIGSQANAGT